MLAMVKNNGVWMLAFLVFSVVVWFVVFSIVEARNKRKENSK